MCNKGNYDITQDTENLFHQIRIQEPYSYTLYYHFGMILSRTCGTNEHMISECVKFLQQALRLVPENIPVNLELAYQHFLLKNYKDAVTIYKNVARLDDSATEALIGLTKCRLETESKEEVGDLILAHFMLIRRTRVIRFFSIFDYTPQNVEETNDVSFPTFWMVLSCKKNS